MPRLPGGKPRYSDRHKIYVNPQRRLDFDAQWFEEVLRDVPLAPPPVMGTYDVRPDVEAAIRMRTGPDYRLATGRPENVPPHLRTLANDIAFLEERLAHEADGISDEHLAQCSQALDLMREEMRRAMAHERFIVQRLTPDGHRRGPYDPWADTPVNTLHHIERRTEVPPARVPPPAGGALTYEMLERATERYIHAPSASALSVSLPMPRRRQRREPEIVESVQQREERLRVEMEDVFRTTARAYPVEQQRRPSRGSAGHGAVPMEPTAVRSRPTEQRAAMRHAHETIFFLNPDEWT